MSCHTKSFSDWTSPFRQPQRRRLDGGSLGSCGLLWSSQLRPVQRDPPQRAPEAGEAAGVERGRQESAVDDAEGDAGELGEDQRGAHVAAGASLCQAFAEKRMQKELLHR